MAKIKKLLQSVQGIERLVTFAFFLILGLIRRSSAAYLLREVLLIVVGLFIVTTVLPLPVFDWVIRAFLLAILVATPIVFQTQIRQFLGRISRIAGIARAARYQTHSNAAGFCNY